MMMGVGQVVSQVWATPDPWGDPMSYAPGATNVPLPPDYQYPTPAPTGTRSIQPYGPTVPLDYVAQPFNCPPGSDFTASREVGMCVAADYSPIYQTSAVSGAKTYYNLDGTIGGVEPKQQAVTGVPDQYLYIGAGVLIIILLTKGRR
jgi:hypothetical protein